MDLYQLRYFLEAARELNFTRAAENLGVTPPAVSRSVALLERSVKRKLLHRTRRSVTLTAYGETLLARARTVFDELEAAESELADLSEAPKKLRLGSREMISHYLLPGPLADFQKRYPDTRFGIHELEPEAMASALKKDRLDLAFHYAPIPDPGLEHGLLGRLTSHIYASKAYLKRAGNLKTLDHPFIAPRYFGADPSAPSPDGFPDDRVARNVRYEAEFLETHRRFVLQGLCVGVLPDIVFEEELRRGRVAALKGPPLHRDIYWIRRRNRVLPEAVKGLVGAVRARLKG